MKNYENIKITDYLAKGKENARSGNTLKSMLRLNNYREITLLINKSRAEGNIICSNTKGYYLPENETEVKTFVKSMHHRIKEIKRSVKPATELLNKEGVIYDD